MSLRSGEEGSLHTLTPVCPGVFGAAHVSENPSPGLVPPRAPAPLWVANPLTQPTELSQNPSCTETRRVGHQGVCKVLFGLQVKFIIDLEADLSSHVPVPAYSGAARSILPFRPCWRGCWRARAVCLHKNQTLLSYQNKARLAVSLSARGERKKKKRKEQKSGRFPFHCSRVLPRRLNGEGD